MMILKLNLMTKSKEKGAARHPMFPENVVKGVTDNACSWTS